MHAIDLILAITIGLVIASLLGYFAHRIGLPPIIGYLLAGFMMGPNTPGYVANKEMTDQLAEIGVILLMFGVGLQFHWKELFQVRRVAIPGAIGQSLTATLLGCVISHYWGWGWSAGLVFGMAISVASTVVLLRVLSDYNSLHTPAGHIAVGWLVVEDIFTVLVLVMMPALFGTGESNGILLAFGWTIVKMTLLLGCTTLIGGRFIPWLLDHVAATRSRELFTLTVLAIALGIAVGTAKLFGASMALGAFLAGMIVGRSEFSLRAASDALPMRDAFAVLFFVSVGMLFNPTYLLEEPWIISATLAIVLLAKPLIAWIIVLWLGYPVRTALTISFALAQIGEFSFILAALGKELHVLPEAGMNCLVATAIFSIGLNPFLFRFIDPVEKQLQRFPLIWRFINSRLQSGRVGDPVKQRDPTQHTAIVIGYGPVGSTIVRLLQENGIEPTIIDLNLDTVRRLQAEGFQAVYGDATHMETLKQAGVVQSLTLVLSAGNMTGGTEVIRLARELNPKIKVLAHSAYLRQAQALRQSGADAIFSGEGEVALTMTEYVLRQFGATADQIDRERERIHEELIENRPPVSS